MFVLAEATLGEDDDDKEEPAPVVTPKPSSTTGTQSAIDLTAEFLLPLLNPENVANLVCTMAKLSFCFSLNAEIIIIIIF